MGRMPKREEKVLPCVLREDEKLQYGIDLATELTKLDETKGERTLINERVKVHEAEVERLRSAIYTGREDRSVECIWEYDWPRAEKTLFRTDTGEVIRTDRIEEWERQEKFEEE